MHAENPSVGGDAGAGTRRRNRDLRAALRAPPSGRARWRNAATRDRRSPAGRRRRRRRRRAALARQQCDSRRPRGAGRGRRTRAGGHGRPRASGRRRERGRASRPADRGRARMGAGRHPGPRSGAGVQREVRAGSSPPPCAPAPSARQRSAGADAAACRASRIAARAVRRRRGVRRGACPGKHPDHPHHRPSAALAGSDTGPAPNGAPDRAGAQTSAVHHEAHGPRASGPRADDHEPRRPAGRVRHQRRGSEPVTARCAAHWRHASNAPLAHPVPEPAGAGPSGRPP